MNPVRPRILVVSACLLVVGSLAVKAAEPEDIIKYRENVMKANGGHMGATAAILQGKVDNKNQLADHVKALQAINKDIVSLFPKGSDFGETEALDAVWQKPADFKKRADDAKAKSEALAKAVATSDSKNYMPRFKELNDACKACHKDFRKEQK